MSITISACTADDVDLICAISAFSFEHTFHNSCSADDMMMFLTQSYNHDAIAQELANPDSSFYLLRDDQHNIAGYMKINVGAAQGEDMGEHMMEIARFYVLPQYKRRGYGRAMMDFALAHAHTIGARGVWLGVWEHNEPAKAFYTKSGFTFVGSHPYPVGNDPQVDLLMRMDFDQQ